MLLDFLFPNLPGFPSGKGYAFETGAILGNSPKQQKSPYKTGEGPAEAAIFPSVFSISAIAPDRWDDNPKLLAQRRNNDAGFNTSVAWSW